MPLHRLLCPFLYASMQHISSSLCFFLSSSFTQIFGPSSHTLAPWSHLYIRLLPSHTLRPLLPLLVRPEPTAGSVCAGIFDLVMICICMIEIYDLYLLSIENIVLVKTFIVLLRYIKFNYATLHHIKDIK